MLIHATMGELTRVNSNIESCVCMHEFTGREGKKWGNIGAKIE